MGQSHSGFVYDVNSNRLPLKTAFADPSSIGNNGFIAAVPGAKIRVLSYRLQGSGTVNVKFTDTDGTTLSQTWEFQAREGVAVESQEFGFEFETALGKGVQINLSAAVQAHVSVQYVEVP